MGLIGFLRRQIVRFHFRKRWFACALIGVVGCAAIPPDRGYADVREQMRQRGVALPADAGADRSAFIDEILAQPITADAAVRVALVNNPRIQVEFAKLGLTGAEVVQAGRLSNPTLAMTWQTSSRSSDASRYDAGLTQNFAQLLLMGARTRFTKGEFERAKLDATQRVLDLAAEVSAAYYEAVGARQVAQMRATVADAAVASAELAARFKDAGNITALELAIQQAAASQARLDGERARLDADRAAVALNEKMGLDAGAHWQIADALPVPTSADDSLDALQQLAREQRADLDSDRRAVVLLEDALGLTRSYRYLGEVEVGAQYERDTDRSRLIGPTLSIQLPIFNQGQAAVLRAESLLDAARAQARAKELEISNAVLTANDRVVAARQRIARLSDETIPLREQIVARTQEQVNYMLVGVFDLIRAKQDEYDVYQLYLEAIRDYWLARVDLSRAVGGHLPGDLPVLPDAAPAAADVNHHHGER
jgi:cobalt-zinc-cadmium efflux system outer membrane protein